MARTQTRLADQTQVFVVDPHPEDYVRLLANSAPGGRLFQFVNTGSDALKLQRNGDRSIWLVNIDLPDGSGCDVAAAIRARDPHAVVYLVGDVHDPAQELKALMVGGAMYVCKPADDAWLSIEELWPRMLARCA